MRCIKMCMDAKRKRRDYILMCVYFFREKVCVCGGGGEKP